LTIRGEIFQIGEIKNDPAAWLRTSTESKSTGRAMPARSRNAVREPLLNFVLDPTDRPRSYLDATRALAAELEIRPIVI
jgi:hypothetical protein